MKRFTELYTQLDETTKTNRKVAALVAYFSACSPEDGSWAVYFLSGRRIKRLIKANDLRAWAAEHAGVEDWLFEECYEAVGDRAETVALLLPRVETPQDFAFHQVVEAHLLPLRDLAPEAQRTALCAMWDALETRQRFVWNKLITGAFRVGVSQRMVTRALAEVTGVPQPVVAHRLMGHWSPTPEFFRWLFDADTQDADRSRPYPFFLAHPWEDDIEKLGDAQDWQAEWKWDGIRAQYIRRDGRSYLWTRGEELVTERYPELEAVGEALPEGTVIDGELLPWREGQVLPFAQMQRRIGRKTIGKKLLREVPVVLMAYDLVEWQGEDIRTRPLRARRALLEEAVAQAGLPDRLRVSPLVEAESWPAYAKRREESRERLVEGLMLKRKDAPYRVGRTRGDWWKWKVEPYTIDAVLVYAQRGHGRRASLYTDYTFAVWQEDNLVPFAKAYSGLTDDEMRKVDRFVRQNTVEKFGPVRSVKPQLVFELGFEAIQRSTRHKSGIAVRFPRMLRWRTDKQPGDADTLDTIQSLLPERA